MSRRAPGLTLLAALCLVVAATPRAMQDWRGPALASFDEAWQTINDTYYDPKFGGVDWDAVKRELRPRAEAATSPDQVRAIIRDMVSRLGQSHFGLLSMASSADTLPGAAMPPIEIRVAPAGIVIDARDGRIAGGARGCARRTSHSGRRRRAGVGLDRRRRGPRTARPRSRNLAARVSRDSRQRRIVVRAPRARERRPRAHHQGHAPDGTGRDGAARQSAATASRG